jgi:UPF0716 family protein affecting phage T7 exclusion
MAFRRPWGFISAAIGACMLLPQFATAHPAQQNQTMTATASALGKSDAYTASMDKAFGLCLARASSTFDDDLERVPAHRPDLRL